MEFLVGQGLSISEIKSFSLLEVGILLKVFIINKRTKIQEKLIERIQFVTDTWVSNNADMKALKKYVKELDKEVKKSPKEKPKAHSTIAARSIIEKRQHYGKR